MSEMVERVARAMYAAAAEAAATRDEYPGWNADLYFRRAWFISQARAAIAAMREPTEAMVENAEAGWHPAVDQYTEAPQCWRSMIDAALKD